MEEVKLTMVYEDTGTTIILSKECDKNDVMIIGVEFTKLTDDNKSVFSEEAKKSDVMIESCSFLMVDQQCRAMLIKLMLPDELAGAWKIELLPEGKWLMSRVSQLSDDSLGLSQWQVKFDKDGKMVFEKKTISERESKEMEFLQKKIDLVDDMRKKYGV